MQNLVYTSPDEVKNNFHLRQNIILPFEESKMHDFIHVSKTEAKPVKKELITIIHEVQDIVRNEFTFQFRTVGSSSRNMITYDTKSNIGFDFDFDLEVNDGEEDYDPDEIRHIMKDAIDEVAPEYGYKPCEDSTSVLTIKKVNTSKIIHSCDFALVHNYCDGRQQYIRFNKNNSNNNYTWEFQGKEFKNLNNKIGCLKSNGYWTELRDYYIVKKNLNNDPNKHSRSILAESVNEVYQKVNGK